MSMVTQMGDSISQFLTTIPFALQFAIMFLVVVPICALLAMVWLRLVDVCGAAYLRLSAAGRAKLKTRNAESSTSDHNHK